MPPRCCPHWAQGTNSDGCTDLPNETESIRYPYFARGYPKGRKLLSISSPVKAGDTLSPSHPPKLLRVRASFIWTLWKFWSPGIPERECLPAIHHSEARCGTLWMMWQVHSLGKTRLRSGFPWTTQLKLLCRGHTKLLVAVAEPLGRTSCRGGCNSNQRVQWSNVRGAELKGSWSPAGHKVTQQADNSPRKSCHANLVLHRGDRKYFVNFLSLRSSERHCRKCVKRSNSRGEELLEAGGEWKVKNLMEK